MYLTNQGISESILTCCNYWKVDKAILFLQCDLHFLVYVSWFLFCTEFILQLYTIIRLFSEGKAVEVEVL